jgi:hypothetical protein
MQYGGDQLPAFGFQWPKLLAALFDEGIITA